MGRFFKKEMHFESLPYCNEKICALGCAYLFAVRPDPDLHYAIGACCFNWVEWQDAPPGYSLDWIWIHPFYRRVGLLSKVWPFFQETYGRFWVQKPHSLAMARFLNKQGYQAPVATEWAADKRSTESFS
jgi:hypothetical protein